MFELSIDPSVLKKLRTAFPKPANAADKSLEKYRLLLLEIMNEAAQHERSPFDVLNNIYVADVRRLSQKGPRVGASRMRLHAWLNDNDLSLIEFVSKGNNLTKLRSKIKISALATLTNPTANVVKKMLVAQTDVELDQALNGTVYEQREVFDLAYPNFYELSSKQRKEQFELVSVDVTSLRAYIYWLNTNAGLISESRKLIRTEQALKILRIAMYAQGKFPQKRKPSEFGRMYYEGLSVQNVSKDLRRAMLGDCWEYDIRSSVISFKLGFAGEILQQFGCTESVQRVFAMSYWYVVNKDSMIAEIAHQTFGVNSLLTREKRFKLVKQALTAIGFGASAREKGWKTLQGNWANPAIVDIFRNADERKRFSNHYAVKSFIEEQAIFDEYIVNCIRSTRPDLWDSELVKADKKTSTSKVVALVYQHVETIAMNAAREKIREQGNQVLASIHDAVVVRKRIGFDDLEDVNYAMQTATGNSYLRFKGTQYERYKRYSIEPDAGIDLRFTLEELLKALAVSFPDGLVPDGFDFNSCLMDA